MRKTIHKVIFVWDFDKEEKWLNEMAAKGLCLVSVGFCRYEFEDCQPGEYHICMQLLDKVPNHPESQKYMEFLETTGVEHVGSWFRWVYFRKPSAEGSFSLFSDRDSRLKHLTQIINLIAVVTIANLIIGVYNLWIAAALASPVNYLGLINLGIGIWGTIGVSKLMKKRQKMKEESRLFE